MFTTSLTSDPEPLQRFKIAAGKPPPQVVNDTNRSTKSGSFSRPIASKLALHVFDWDQAGATEHANLGSVEELTALDMPPIRVVYVFSIKFPKIQN